jgi:hypothetical protein
MRPSRRHAEISSVVASREILAPASSLAKMTNAMSSACEKSPRFCHPSTVITELCVTVCGDCKILTPGAYTEMGALVTLPDESTTQWAAVTTMRLVHNAPLHTLEPLTKRTTAVFPSAELPPTTACAGDAAIGAALEARANTSARRSGVRCAVRRANLTLRTCAFRLFGTWNTL